MERLRCECGQVKEEQGNKTKVKLRMKVNRKRKRKRKIPTALQDARELSSGVRRNSFQFKIVLLVLLANSLVGQHRIGCDISRADNEPNELKTKQQSAHLVGADPSRPRLVVASRWQNDVHLPCKPLDLAGEQQTVSRAGEFK